MASRDETGLRSLVVLLPRGRLTLGKMHQPIMKQAWECRLLMASHHLGLSVPATVRAHGDSCDAIKEMQSKRGLE